jgi:predicted dehydrogenase
MKKVTVGIIGSGFAARIHGESYGYIHGIEAEIKAVSSTTDRAYEYAKDFGIPDVYKDYREMLKDPQIDVVDIIVPPNLHIQCIEDAVNAGKHVICEKPFAGYFGGENDEEPIGLKVCREKMFKSVLEKMDKVCTAVRASGKKFMYAENWVYVPSVLKSAEMIKAKKTKQLFIKAEESHSGSHAPHAAQWKMNGGGSLIRQGCHPLSAVLFLKKVEAQARGEEIKLSSVLADTGNLAEGLGEEEKKYIESRPVDVEDWASMNLTFSDGTKAMILSGDMVLGGVRNNVEIYGNNGVLLNLISPNDSMKSYFVDEDGLENIYMTEKAQNKTGWQSIFLSENYARGYVGELQDFMECVAFDKEPLSGLQLAYDTTAALYAAYQSAAQNKRVYL